MNSFNFTILEGITTKDAVLNETKAGKKVCNFIIKATSGGVETSFNVTAWERLAQTCGKCLKKGMKVLVSGELKKDYWKDAGGKQNTKTYLSAREVNFLSPKGSGV